MTSGLRAGGGMGDNMTIVTKDDEDFHARLVFDMCFYMLINIIFLNIVFGIIVDTFSQMRDEYDARKLDTADNCFVCGLTRGDFGKGGKNFQVHIDKHHDPWKYVYYLYYLTEKKEDELSGLEQAVLFSFRRLNTDWLPIGSTLFLESDEGDDQLTAIQASIDAMAENVEKAASVSDKLDTFEKKMMKEMGKISDEVKGNQEGEEMTESNVSNRGGGPKVYNLISSGISGAKREPQVPAKPPIGVRGGRQVHSMRDNRMEGSGNNVDQSYGTNDPSIRDHSNLDRGSPNDRYGGRTDLGFQRRK